MSDEGSFVCIDCTAGWGGVPCIRDLAGTEVVAHARSVREGFGKVNTWWGLVVREVANVSIVEDMRVEHGTSRVGWDDGTGVVCSDTNPIAVWGAARGLFSGGLVDGVTGHFEY